MTDGCVHTLIFLKKINESFVIILDDVSYLFDHAADWSWEFKPFSLEWLLLGQLVSMLEDDWGWDMSLSTLCWFRNTYHISVHTRVYMSVCGRREGEGKEKERKKERKKERERGEGEKEYEMPM